MKSGDRLRLRSCEAPDEVLCGWRKTGVVGRELDVYLAPSGVNFTAFVSKFQISAAGARSCTALSSRCT